MAVTAKVPALADRLRALLGKKKAAASDALDLVRESPLAEIDAPGKKRATALHVACEQRRSDVVAALVARGAAVSPRGEHDDTPLHVAALQRDLASLRILLDAGADARALNQWGESPLHAAGFGASWACLDALLSHHTAPDLHAVGAAGRSVLALACWGLHRDEDAALESVTRLLEAGASANVFDTAGNGAVHFACTAKLHRVAGLVAGHTTAVDVSGLHAAVSQGWPDVADALLARSGGPAAYPKEAASEAFRRAVRHGSVALCAWVLARWPDVDVRAPETSAKVLEHAVVRGDEAMVDYLLGLGAPAEFPSVRGEGDTLLEHALLHHQWGVVARLISHGVSREVPHRDALLAAAPIQTRALFDVRP